MGMPNQPSETVGWTFPAKGKTPARIVTLDGLVRNVIEIGEPVPVSDAFREVPRGTVPQWPFGASATPDTLGLLLIAGEKTLAEQLANKPAIRPMGDNGFISRLFDQAVTAHMVGDDLIALRAARMVQRFRPDFEMRALEQTGTKLVAGPNGNPVTTTEQFPYLNVLPELLADTERRLCQPRRPVLDPKELAKQPVSVLIDRLDEVSARQWGQPGGVNTADDPIVAALIQIGKPAAEPLLDAIEKDTRLTRSVSYHRDFFPTRNLIPVRAAAYAAFLGIADTTVYSASYGEKIDVAGLRKFWAENRDLAPAERWFRILEDDSAGQRRWMDAANRLFNGGYPLRKNINVAPKPLKAMDVVGHSNPSLSDLLTKRARQLCGDGPTLSSSDWYACADGLRLALLLSQWDGPAAKAVLRDTTNRTMAMAIEPNGYSQSLSQTAIIFIQALERRAELGDTTGWTEYATWLPNIPAMEGGSEGVRIFEPLARQPENPAFRGLGQRLFLTPGAKNSPLTMATEHPGWNWAESMAVSPLLAIPEFQQAVVQILENQTVFGDTWVDENGTLFVRHEGSSGGIGGDREVLMDPRRPSPTERLPVRIGDSMAKALTRLKGAPKFQPYWPTAEKDAAILKMKEFLKTNAGNVDHILAWPNNWRESGFGG